MGGAPGKGSTFRVLLPPMAEADTAVPQPRRRTQRKRSGAKLNGRVLVVDDEEMVGEFMGDLLESWGLSVTVKSNALDARELVARNPHAFELILTDQTMPKLTGIELARQLAGVRPDLPIILYTGYSESLSSEEIQHAGIRALVRKPIDPNALLTVLRTHLPASVSAPPTDGRAPLRSAEDPGDISAASHD